MNITIADETGFCFGVKRALDLAYEALNTSNGKPVYTLGELVHNPDVIEKLEQEGINPVNEDELSSVETGILVLRAHGVPPTVVEKAEQLGFEIIDSTCPRVKKVHDIVRELKKEEYEIVIVGKAKHAEVVGISGQIGGKCTIMEKPVETSKFQQNKKLGIVAQTTTSRKNFLEISAKLIEKSGETRIFDTICPSTMKRQVSTIELAKNVGVILVIGGKNSSNTHHLWKVCSEVNFNAYHIENPEEIDPDWIELAEDVGITTGASTPDYMIDKVVKKIQEIVSDIKNR